MTLAMNIQGWHWTWMITDLILPIGAVIMTILWVVTYRSNHLLNKAYRRAQRETRWLADRLYEARSERTFYPRDEFERDIADDFQTDDETEK